MIDPFAPITMTSTRIRAGELSPVALTEACLARIEALNPTLNAFITVSAESALAAAHEAEAEIQAGRWRGPLHGIPVGLKDFFDTAGIRTTAAFRFFADRVPTEDAVVVQRLKAAGAIILGKLNMHELGMGTTSLVSHFGPMRNPWQTDHVAGGSSGGSAAAVAAGLCFATVDTDAIGSCRLPAAICGVVGFKASYGLITGEGILAGEQGPGEVVLRLSHVATQTRTVEDAVILLDVLGDSAEMRTPPASDFQTDMADLATDTLRIGVASNYASSPPVRTAFDQGVATLRALGFPLSEVELPLDAPFAIETIDADRAAISDTLFAEMDVMVLPTTAEATPTIAAAQQAGPQAVASTNTYFANYYGLPAISVPCGYDDSGLPLGLQVVGPTWHEARVLAVARQFEQATRWYLAQPVAVAEHQ